MTRVLANLVLFGALLLPMSAIADDAANEALARRFYAEFNARSFNAFSEFIATDVVDRMAAPGAGNGAGAVRQRMEALVAEVPDARISIQLILVSGDYVTVVTNVAGTSGGRMPADQRPVSYRAIDIWLIRDGLLAEIWHIEQN
jgi:ketosteroid isomerase-like protein